MKESLFQYLACPSCGAELLLNDTEHDGQEIISGELRCGGCQSTFPIRSGIPRFADPECDEAQRTTAENFGAQWLVFDQVQGHHEEQFLDWIAPVTRDFVRDKVVLDGGCGKGRHTRLAGLWGARDVIGIDLSVAVEAAYRNTKDLPNVHIVQADIYRLPLKRSFDYAFSIGVLHHLPDPRGGFDSLIKHVKPGGAVSAWVYGRENNGWIVRVVNPVREHFTSKLPPRLLYFVSYVPAVMLYAALKLIYAPLARTGLKRHLFYGDYLSYIARFPFVEIHSIVHDHLTAPVAFYIRREEFAEWFDENEIDRAEIHWHNRNSWRGLARVRTSSRLAEARCAKRSSGLAQ
jgi:SAM-dependent methyltransferase